MTTGALGDLAQGYMLRQRTSALKADINQLTQELSTGQITDVRGSLSGNYSFLTEVDRKTTVLAAYGVATSEATHFAQAMQLALGSFGEQARELSNTLISAGTSSSGADAFDVATEARAALEVMVGKLNGTSAGRALFSGVTTDQAPLVDADTILTDLAAAIAGATSPADMMAQAQVWFDDPAGFAASAYQGSATPLSEFALSPTDRLTIDIQAIDPALKQAMKGAAVAALATDAAFALDTVQQAELFSLIGQNLIVGQEDVIALQSRVGLAEAQIDRVVSRNAAELTSLSMARNELLNADPYEVATRLEEAQFQLQSLYSVTVRMSQLSLVNYL